MLLLGSLWVTPDRVRPWPWLTYRCQNRPTSHSHRHVSADEGASRCTLLYDILFVESRTISTRTRTQLSEGLHFQWVRIIQLLNSFTLAHFGTRWRGFRGPLSQTDNLRNELGEFGEGDRPLAFGARKTGRCKAASAAFVGARSPPLKTISAQRKSACDGARTDHESRGLANPFRWHSLCKRHSLAHDGTIPSRRRLPRSRFLARLGPSWPACPRSACKMG